jgi:hypothetical protein
MRDPYKYGNTTPVTSANADAVISQTTNLQLVSGPAYTLNEYVYQGDSPNLASAYGFLNSVTDSGTTVRLTKVVGTFVTGNPLIGVTSGVSRTVTSTSNPTFQPYSGDMLYIENDTATTRSDGQAENIKMIVSF